MDAIFSFFNSCSLSVTSCVCLYAGMLLCVATWHTRVCVTLCEILFTKMWRVPILFFFLLTGEAVMLIVLSLH